MTNLVWRTVQKRIKDLLPYEHNPRRMTERQVEDLKKSIEKFNLVEVPAIDLDNRIIAGHQRLKIMQLLGRENEMIDVRVPNRKLTEEEFKEYLIRSNKNRGDFDYDILANSFEVNDLLTWGFTEPELGIHTPIEYDGMPEFIQEDAVFRSISVHFNNQNDVDEFFKLIGQEATEKTKYIWFPKQERNVFADKTYQSNEQNT